MWLTYITDRGSCDQDCKVITLLDSLTRFWFSFHFSWNNYRVKNLQVNFLLYKLTLNGKRLK